MGFEHLVLRRVPMAGELVADDLQGPFQPKPFCESIDSVKGFTGEECTKAEAVIKYLRLGI